MEYVEFGALGLVSIISPSLELKIMHRFFCWIPYSLKNSLTKFENFLSTESTAWKPAQPVQQISVEVHYSSKFKFGALELVLVISPSSELEIMHCFFFWIPYSERNIVSNFHIFFLNWIDQLGTVQPVSRASLRGELFLLILRPKSYLVGAHKPQISPKHGLGPVLGNVIGFLQPTWVHLDTRWLRKEVNVASYGP